MNDKISFKVKRPNGVVFCGNGETRIHKRLKGLSFEESGHTGFQKELTEEQLKMLDGTLSTEFPILITTWDTEKFEADTTYEELSEAIKEGKKPYFKFDEEDTCSRLHPTDTSLMENAIVFQLLRNTGVPATVICHKTVGWGVGEYLSDYYKKNETYSKIEIDDIKKGINNTTEKLSERIDTLEKNNIIFITDIEGITLFAEDNQEAYLGKFSELAISLPTEFSDTYNSYLCFTADDAFLYLEIYSEYATVKLRGDDVSSDGVFTPVAGTMYEIAFKKVNTTEDGTSIIVGRVGAV